MDKHILQTEEGEVGWANVKKMQGGAVRLSVRSLTNIYSFIVELPLLKSLFYSALSITLQMSRVTPPGISDLAASFGILE